MTTNTLHISNHVPKEPPTGQSPREPQYEVICVCGGIGFPISGSAKRIINVGRALQAAGIDFRVLHSGPSPVSLNTQRSGVHRGIPFEYTTWRRRPASPFTRLPVYLRAFAGLAWRLCRIRTSPRRTAVYLFALEGPLVFYTGVLCRLLGIPLIQEMCEWFPCRKSVTPFTKWLYRKPIFAFATGVLAISTRIQRYVQEVSAVANPRLLVHHLPSIVDSEFFVGADPHRNGDEETVPCFVWCGVGWTQDLLFVIRAMALVIREGYRCKLRIISAAFYGWGPQTVRDYAAEQGLPPEAIEIVGSVDDRALAAYYKSAAALLLPMWDDETSRTRVPNRLAESLASGRPAITSPVGDIADFLVDGANAYLSKPGSERDYADNMISVLLNPARASRIGAVGQRTCMDRLDYRFQIDSLSKFFMQCIESHNSTH